MVHIDSKAQAVADAFSAQFPNCKDFSGRPSVQAIEKFMRPFAPISYEVQRQIDDVLSSKGLAKAVTGIHDWWEANFAVSGSGEHHQRIVAVLLRDPCTCVVPHLPAAIDCATNEVDRRLITLREMWDGCGRDVLKFHERLESRGD